MYVSVIIPMFNAEQTIAESIGSVLETGIPSLEIIVVDDASTDGSLRVVRRIAESEQRIRLIESAGNRNQGPAKARNRGVMSAQGELIAFLDSDDKYFACRFDDAIRAFSNDPELDATIGQFTYFFEKSDGSRGLSSELDGRVCGAEPADDLFSEKLNGRLGMHTSTVTMRRTVFESIGYFPDLHYSEDKAFWLRLLSRNRTACFRNGPVSGYRIHDQSWCSQGRSSERYKMGPILAAIDFLEWSRTQRGVPERYRIEALRYLKGKILFQLPTAGKSLTHSLRKAILKAMVCEPKAVCDAALMKALLRSFYKHPFASRG